MDRLPIGYGGPGPSGDPFQYGISNTGAYPTMSTNVHGHGNTNIGNVLNSYNSTYNVGVGEQSLSIQAWLSPLEPYRRHHDVSTDRVYGVGDWVLSRSEFESWSKGRDGLVNPALLCYGEQGVGKTYISSLVIDTLRKQPREQDIAVLCLYCDYQVQKDQSAVNMIGGLLRQVSLRATETPGEIQIAFEESRQRGGYGLRLPEMVELFVRVIKPVGRVYICVDAVDEVLPEDRSKFLDSLQQIIQDAPNTRLFLTGRSYIRRDLDRYLMVGTDIIHIVANQGDIARYLTQKMDNDQYPDLMTENLKNDIMKTILDKASQMFLLVALNIGAILGESSLAGRKKMLKRVAMTGVDLGSAYAQTLHRIREQKGDRSRLGMKVLMWVSHSERPLQIGELRHALAVELESTDLDPENIRPEYIVIGSCLGLVVVDKETSTVRLIHYTLQEYLASPGILPNSHKTLAETCLAYLNSEQINALPANWIPNPREMPFFEYSSFYWGDHAKRELSDRTKSLALKLLTQYNDHISATLLFNHMQSFDIPPVTNHLFTGIHCASYFGIVAVVALLIDTKDYDPNQRDCKGLTPLAWAARKGNEDVMKLLLDWDDVNPNQPDNDGQTPLSGASEHGHEGAVRLLLKRGGVNPDQPDNNGQTALWHASLNGHEGLAQLLLKRDDVNPNKPDNHGRTLLWWASGSGNKGAVRLLLTHEKVDPHISDNIGRTPLLVAYMHGHMDIVALLELRTSKISGAH